MMKKFVAFTLLLVFLLSMVGCGKADDRDPQIDHNRGESSSQPYYFIGEIIEEHPFGDLVKVVDYGNYKFNSTEVYLHEVRPGLGYSVGDYIRVEFNGLFLETDPPQIKSAISITKTEAP